MEPTLNPMTTSSVNSLYAQVRKPVVNGYHGNKMATSLHHDSSSGVVAIGGGGGGRENETVANGAGSSMQMAGSMLNLLDELGMLCSQAVV